MFANIGRKIKNFAKFSFGIGVLVSIIGAIYVIVSSLNGREPIVGILTGLLIAVGGVIVSWLQTFLLYGFGELVDSNQKILRNLEDRRIDDYLNGNNAYNQYTQKPLNETYKEPPKALQSVVQSQIPDASQKSTQ